MNYIINDEEIEFIQIPSTGATSNIYLSKDKKYIIKEIIEFNEYDIYKREQHILLLLHEYKFDWSPQLICSNDNNQLLVLNYCGELFSLTNKPDDLHEQYNNIINDLESLNIQHNDIKNTELLIKDNKLYLCDYGWASIHNNHNCNIGLWNGDKPHGYIEDREALTFIIKQL